MADTPSLGDFFAKKTKKKIKATNLNNTSTTGKPEEAAKKVKTKNAEEDGWQEEELVAATMKVEAAGKLTREEEKKEEEDARAPSWGNVKTKDTQGLNDKKFPTLAKSIQSSNINLEDNSGKVNIATSKNVFSALDAEDEDEDGLKRPTKIQPAMVTKKKGEMQKDAIQREVGRYKKDEGKDDKKESKAGEEDEDEEDDGAEAKEKEAKSKKKEDKKAKLVEASATAQQELEEDVKIQPDLAAAKAKYSGRKKLPKKDLPREELQEEKENKPQAASKKKWANIEDEEDDKGKKLAYWED